ncbi:hypothetical protein ACFL09_03110, partial [Planctomycetota bacterium]
MSEQPADEAALDQYVLRERPVLCFLDTQIRRAPWWTISLLVHLLVLVVLWRWPYAMARAPEETRPHGPYGIYRPESPPPPPPVKPPVDPDVGGLEVGPM